MKKHYILLIASVFFIFATSAHATSNTTTYDLFIASGEDAYQLSMPLLASALQKDQQLFNQILPKMITALRKIPETSKENSFKAWLLGRVLLAADNIDATELADTTKIELIRLLNDHNTTRDAFSAWAWGYLVGSADLTRREYETACKKMLNQAIAVTQTYQKNINNHLTEKDLQSKKSDALWAWVMVMQATANVGDEKNYRFVKEQILAMTGEKSVVDALSTSLLRAEDGSSSDFPAWAFAITRLAAANMNDSSLYNSLKNPLEKSIADATMIYQIQKEKNPTNANRISAEKILAEANNALAEGHWKESQN